MDDSTKDVTPPEQAQDKQPLSTPPQKTDEGRILIVEDDDALAGVYEMRLQAEGFVTKRVSNGEEALSAAISFKPDLVLLDIMMPKVSGFDVLDIMRNTPDTAKVKIIMLTALSQEGDKQRAQNLGVDDYLVKSQVVISDVVDKIKNHLSNR
jgi:DNA-binding response OmpR family regulator